MEVDPYRGDPSMTMSKSNNRKESTDSGIFEVNSISLSRKTSNMSTNEIKEDNDEQSVYEQPSEELCESIVQQVEFYFSDANIKKDKFLMKHVKRNKEGFVSLKLISSFKRIRHLCKDWHQVATAIQLKSTKLEVNDSKTKVRRLEALPEYDETAISRTVVALNLPIERPTIEEVAKLFSVCGDIVLVRILRPGNPIPADVKHITLKYPEMMSKVSALVEFESTEFAMKAVTELNTEEEIKVIAMKSKTPKLSKKTASNQSKSSTPPHSGKSNHSFLPGQRNKNDQIKTMQKGENEVLSVPKVNVSSFYNCELENAATAPWMMRRLVLGDIAASGLALPPNVVRMPNGPDKGKGFKYSRKIHSTEVERDSKIQCC